MAATIYLHWAATPYTWQRSGLYHSIISGDGRVQRMHAYTVDLPAHTWHRNSNSVALWDSPDFVDRSQGFTGVSVWAAMNCCS